MVTREELIAGIKEIVHEQLVLNTEVEEVSLDARLDEDYGADSLDAVEIIMSIEEKYGLDIRDEDIQGVKTVEDVVNLTERLLKEKEETSRRYGAPNTWRAEP